MIKIYGIKNCDTVQKALKWLDANKLEYTFHNYKEEGIDEVTLERWLQHMSIEKLVNSRSTTYRELPESEKVTSNNKQGAIALMMKHNSIIKRPVWDMGNGQFFLGWDEGDMGRLLLKRRT